MNVCQRPDYLEAIYDNERRNRHPQASCAAGYNLPSEAFCTLPPSFVAQPFLTLDDNGDLQLHDALAQHSQTSCGGACNKGPASAILDACDAKFGRPYGYSRMAPSFDASKSSRAPLRTKEAVTADALAHMQQGKQPWAVTGEAIRQLYNRAGCEPCDLVLSCGPNWRSAACGKALQPRKKAGLQPINQYGVPTLQMPNMDAADYADGDSYEARPMYFNRPISQLDAAGSNNPFLAQFAKYAFQAEKRRELDNYGIGAPPFPKPCPPTPVGVAPRYDVPSQQARTAQPIVIDRQALFASDNCGCNRSECRGGPGTTCTKCFSAPQSVAGIYARQSK